jgi:RNA polymerase sigma factor (sigma-70 family)
MASNPAQNIVETVKDYGKGLFSFIRGRVKTEEDAEDILQDVWYQLSNVVDIDEIEHISGWLFKVARNKIIDRYRKKTPESFDDLNFENEDGEFNFSDILLADDDDPETVYIKELFWQELFTALDELPENQRQVFVWNEMEDKTLQQIADETGSNLKTVISRKGYAVKYLRTRLETLYQEFLNY